MTEGSPAAGRAMQAFTEDAMNELVDLYNRAKSARDDQALDSANKAIQTYLEGEALTAESFELQQVAAATIK